MEHPLFGRPLGITTENLVFHKVIPKPRNWSIYFCCHFTHGKASPYILYSCIRWIVFIPTLSFSFRNKKLKEEDIVICECKYDVCNPESACGENCLNVLTNTECTPGYCLCGEFCRNQVR